jgi:murein DD-endopeptidase MepM/ murein hydrolase activator NlpD
MGWRIHPIKKVKKFHTGTDIWAGAEPCVIEAAYQGKVIKVGSNPSGYGNYVILLHKIRGEYYTTLYAHMKNGSIKVKAGQKVAAGTALGKMGSTGASTGKHLHWELHKGKRHVWSDTGKGYIEPVGFFTALIEWEKSIATAPVEAKPDDPVQPEPVHGPAPKPVVPKPRVAARVYTVKRGDTLSAIAHEYKTTVAKLVKLNGIDDPSVIKVGQKIKIG